MLFIATITILSNAFQVYFIFVSRKRDTIFNLPYMKYNNVYKVPEKSKRYFNIPILLLSARG